MDKRAELRDKALKDLQQSGVLMLDGHFDYGNGYHGRVYLNPHQLFRHPSTIWRFAQDPDGGWMALVEAGGLLSSSVRRPTPMRRGGERIEPTRGLGNRRARGSDMAGRSSRAD